MKNITERHNYIYVDTSPGTTPKSGEPQYCSKDAATPRATNITLSTQGFVQTWR